MDSWMTAKAKGTRARSNGPTLVNVMAGFTCALLRIAVGFVFVLAGLSKISTPYEFLEEVLAYDLIHGGIGVATAVILPWLELFIGMALLLDFCTTMAFVTVVILTTGFAVIQMSALGRGLQIDCGCFSLGDGHQLVGYQTILRTLVIASACAVGLIAVKNKRNIQNDSLSRS